MRSEQGIPGHPSKNCYFAAVLWRIEQWNMQRRILTLVSGILPIVLFGQLRVTSLTKYIVPQDLVDGTFRKVEAFEVDFSSLYRYARQHSDSLVLQLQLGSWQRTIVLSSYPMLQEGAKLYIQTDSGLVVQPKENIHFRGHVPETGEEVYAAIAEGYFAARIGNWYVEPIVGLKADDPEKAVYLLYHADDVMARSGSQCLAVEVEEQRQSPPRRNKNVQSRWACYEIVIALAADWEYNQSYGGAIEARRRMSTILGMVSLDWDDAFDNEIQILEGTSFVSDCASCDPWSSTTSASLLLYEFAQWAEGGGFGSSDYSAATLWVSRDISGSSILGIAYTGGMCQSTRYNVCEDFSSSSVLLRQLQSHEIGHNFGLSHVGAPNYIMSANVSGSDQWHYRSKGYVNAHAPLSCMYTCTQGSPPVAGFFADERTGCHQLTVQFYNTSEKAASYYWEFEGGEPAISTEEEPRVHFPTPGEYTVRLTVENAYGADTREELSYIWVIDSPKAHFNYRLSTHVPREVIFTDSSSNASNWYWDFGDDHQSNAPNPRHRYQRDSLYTVTLEVRNPCGSDVYYREVDVYTGLDARFTAEAVHGCDSLCTRFRVVNNYKVTHWHWKFPGGYPEESTDPTPKVCYTKPGIYDVFLRISNDIDADSLFVRGFVRVDSTARLVLRSSEVDTSESWVEVSMDCRYCDSMSLQLDVSAPSIDTLWVLSEDSAIAGAYLIDSTRSVVLPPLNALDTLRLPLNVDTAYIVGLIGYGACNSDTLKVPIGEGTPPVGQLNEIALPSCVGDTLLLKDSSIGKVRSRQWLLYHAGVLIQQSDQEQFTWVIADTGQYKVLLIVGNIFGKDTVVRSIRILWDRPVAAFDYWLYRDGKVDFVSRAQHAEWHRWEVDGDTSYTFIHPSAYLPIDTEVVVRYIVGNRCFAPDTLVRSISTRYVRARFEADTTRGCAPLNVILINRSLYADSVQWWMKGSPLPVTPTDSLLLALTRGGYYWLQMVAYGAGHSVDTFRGPTIVIDEPPQAAFEAIVRGTEVEFSNHSTGTRLQFHWDFGDGKGTDTVTSPRYLYAYSGSYTVVLKASNPLCGTDTHRDTIDIFLTSAVDAEGKAPFAVLPNPFSSSLYLHFIAQDIRSQPEVQIYTAQGVRYELGMEYFRPGVWRITTSHLPVGPYVLRVRYANKYYFIPLIKTGE